MTQLVTLRAAITWTSVAYNAAANVAYLGGAGGELDQYDLTTKALTTLGTLAGGGINGMVYTPATFTVAPSQIVAATYSGGVMAFNPVTKTASTLVPVGTIGNASGIAVTAAGTVYVSGYDQHKLYKLTSGGVATVLAALPGASDGVAVDEARSRVYVVDSDLGKLHIVAMATGAVTDAAGVYQFDGGFWPSPIAYDCNLTALVAVNPGTPSKVSAIALP